MDHLPRLNHRVHAPIEIPCYLQQEHTWDGSDFSGFLERKGFSAKELAEGDFRGKTRDKVLSVVQGWAFFGTIISICKITEVPGDINDFIRKAEDGRLMIDTSNLIDYLRIWIYNERFTLPSEHRQERAEEITAILQLVAKFIDDVVNYEQQGFGPSSQQLVESGSWDRAGFAPFRRVLKDKYADDGHYHDFKKAITDHYYEENRNFFSGELGGPCYEIRDGDFVFKSRAASPSHLLVLSLSILGETIEKARNICYKDQPSILWRTPFFLSVLMQMSGWCPMDTGRICMGAGPSVIYYLSSMDRRSNFGTHEQCCTNYCVAYQINNTTYQGKHTTPSCKCEYVDLQSAFEFVSKCLDEDSVPLVMVLSDEGSETMNIGLTQWDIGEGGPPYVAISHIWSDGIGNTEQNALPACQMHRLQRLVNDLYTDDQKPGPAVPFWIDTLMVPLQDEARKKAIAQMEHVYRSADKVLVLDKTLEAISRELNVEELLIRMCHSPWMSRLWTAQEAYLARDLHFQFSDTSSTIRGLTQRYRKQCLDKDMGRFQSICHDGTAFAQVLTRHLREIIHNEGQVTKEEGDLQALDPIKTYAIYRLATIRLNAWSGAKELAERDELDFNKMTLPMQYRSSSKADDEPLCLALLAGLPVSAFLQFAPDCRMEQLFGQFPEIPGDIIFSERPRINKYARRWIPSSLLDGRNLYGGPPGITTLDGLLVTFPGIILGPSGDNTLFPCRHISPDGLFYLKYEHHTAMYKLVTKNHQRIPEENKGEDGSFGHDPAFGISQHSDVNYQHFAINGSAAALILRGQKGEDDWGKTRDAALASIFVKNDEDGESEEGVLYVKFEISLTLERVEAEVLELDPIIPEMKAEAVFSAQKWCVG